MTKGKTSLIWKILGLLALIFAVMLSLSFLATFISPEKCVFLAYFALAFPFLLLINILFAIILLFNIRKAMIFPIIAIVLNWGNIYTLAKFKSPDFDTKEEKIKVLSYNVNLFNFYSSASAGKKTSQDILAFIQEEAPDIICFQEYSDNLKNPVVKNYISKEIGLKYASKGRFNNNIAFGNKIFSRFPIIKDSLIRFEQSKNLIEFVDIIAHKDTLRLFNFHLESIGFKSSDDKFYTDLIHSPSNSGTDELKKGFVSMVSKINRALVARAKQSQVLSEYISNSPYPCIVCGDLNDPPTSYSYHQISKNLNDSFTKRGFGFGSSYNGKYPAYRIDYILFSDSLYCENFTTARVKFSDHYPIISSLKIKTHE